MQNEDSNHTPLSQGAKSRLDAFQAIEFLSGFQDSPAADIARLAHVAGGALDDLDQGYRQRAADRALWVWIEICVLSNKPPAKSLGTLERLAAVATNQLFYNMPGAESAVLTLARRLRRLALCAGVREGWLS